MKNARSGGPERVAEDTQRRQAKKADFVTALSRGLEVLSCFDAEHRRLTLSQVAKATDLSRGTSRRLLLTLTDLEYVATDGKLFWLRPRILNLAKAYFASDGLAEIAKPFLRSITEQVGESCSMAVLDGRDVVYIARVETKRIFSSGLEPGTRLPAHCVSMGQVLLAALAPRRLDDWLSAGPLVADHRVHVQLMKKHQVGINGLHDRYTLEKRASRRVAPGASFEKNIERFCRNFTVFNRSP